MRLIMEKTKKGSSDGVTVLTYQKGVEYDVPSELSFDLANVFINEKWAKEVKVEEAYKKKVVTPADDKDFEIMDILGEIEAEVNELVEEPKPKKPRPARRPPKKKSKEKE